MGIIDKTLKVIFKGALLLVVVVGLVYFGACVYGNVQAMDNNPMGIPSQDNAAYKITIYNTGNTLLSNDANRSGDVITLVGYWELTGTKYKFHKEALTLNEDIFGPINIKRR